MLAAVGCATGSAPDSLPPDGNAGVANAAADRRGPVVEVPPPVAEQLPPLDPDANPATPLGALRARYFGVWTPEFDGAFPPETCGTAWELDGIAEPVTGVDVSLYGDAATMAALAVMRYEHLVSHALADPTPIAQLCVAVGSVDPARAEALSRLAAQIDTAQPHPPDPPADSSTPPQPGPPTHSSTPAQSRPPTHSSTPLQPGPPTDSSTPTAPQSGSAGFPATVTILAAGPSAVLAVACNSAGADEPPQAGAYLLRVAQGREDLVVDISYRVARVQHRAVADCSDMDAWIAEWEAQVAAWIAEGQAWIPSRFVTTAEQVCSLRPTGGAHECPQDWRS